MVDVIIAVPLLHRAQFIAYKESGRIYVPLRPAIEG